MTAASVTRCQGSKQGQLLYFDKPSLGDPGSSGSCVVLRVVIRQASQRFRVLSEVSVDCIFSALLLMMVILHDLMCQNHKAYGSIIDTSVHAERGKKPTYADTPLRRSPPPTHRPLRSRIRRYADTPISSLTPLQAQNTPIRRCAAPTWRYADTPIHPPQAQNTPIRRCAARCPKNDNTPIRRYADPRPHHPPGPEYADTPMRRWPPRKR